jgi:hypothetical protein
MNRGIAYPLILTALIIVTHFQFPSYFVLSLSFLSDIIITLEVRIISIWKPVSLKLKISSSITLYFVIVTLISLNYKLINFESSTSTF